MNLKSNHTSSYTRGCILRHSVGHQYMFISNLFGWVKSSYFWQKRLLGQFYLIAWRNTFIPAWQHCFGWDYSKIWTTICSHLSPWNLGPWLADITLASSSHWYLAQHDTRFQSASGFFCFISPARKHSERIYLHYLHWSHLPFVHSSNHFCSSFWQTKLYLSQLYILNKHLLIFNINKVFMINKISLRFLAHFRRRVRPSKLGIYGVSESQWDFCQWL